MTGFKVEQGMTRISTDDIETRLTKEIVHKKAFGIDASLEYDALDTIRDLRKKLGEQR